ncbi:MAG: hypothetical protein HFE76_12255 [Firmicutes bacterium]|nr:hypothetical protein [Bacillota bacterium]
MNKGKLYEISLAISVIVLLAGSRIPHMLGRQFTFLENGPPEYFYFVRYALDCIFLFTALIISVLLVLDAIKRLK